MVLVGVKNGLFFFDPHKNVRKFCYKKSSVLLFNGNLIWGFEAFIEALFGFFFGAEKIFFQKMALLGGHSGSQQKSFSRARCCKCGGNTCANKRFAWASKKV